MHDNTYNIHSGSGVPLKKKQEIIYNYCLLICSKEELEMLKEDMENTVCFLEEKITKMSERAKELNSSGGGGLFEAGAYSLMNERIIIDRLKCLLMKAKTIFTDSETALTMTSADADSTSESYSNYVDSDLYEL